MKSNTFNTNGVTSEQFLKVENIHVPVITVLPFALLPANHYRKDSNWAVKYVSMNVFGNDTVLNTSMLLMR